MTDEVALLSITAASIGVVHTLLGPDHYVPFIALASARRWSTRRTLAITLACGTGHVLSSVAIGVIGVAIGLTVSRLEAIEAGRGGFAAWLLITAGLVYLAWGMHRATRSRHGRARGEHSHDGPDAAASSLTPWMLFIVFVLGPCEALIPVLMYPAAVHGVAEMALVTVVFGVATLATMSGVVLLGVRGVSLVRISRLERYSHALAGAAIVLCGLGIRILGL